MSADREGREAACVVVVYAAFVGLSCWLLADALAFDSAEKNGCRVVLVDGFEDTVVRKTVAYTVQDPPLLFNPDLDRYHIIKTTSDTCAGPELDEYRTDGFVLEPYEGNPGTPRLMTFLLGGLVLFMVVGGWWISKWVGACLVGLANPH